MTVKLKELLKSKNPGDEWYSLHAPEELRVWSVKKPWKKGSFSKRGVRILSMAFRSSKEISKIHQAFTLKSPMVLNGGDLYGNYKTIQNRSASLHGRFDDATDVNTYLKELSEKTELDMWEISKINVYNPKEAVEVEFTIHNPDGNGAGLYLYRAVKEKLSIMYPDIMLSDQMKYAASFYENLAHCAADEVTHMVHACGLTKQKPKRQIKTRKKKK